MAATMSENIDDVSILRGPKVPPPYGLQARTIHGVLEYLLSHDESANQKTALVYGGKKVAYGEFNQHANSMARVIQHRMQMTSETGSVYVGLHLESSDITLELVFAVLKLGASFLPLDPKYPVTRLQFEVNDTKPRCVITTREDGQIGEIVSGLPEADRPVILTTDELLSSMGDFPGNNLDESEEIVRGGIGPNFTACVLYTSGSTGLAKGVPLSHNQILHRVSLMRSSFPFTDSDISCWRSSLCYGDSICEIFVPLLHGLTVVVAPGGKDISPKKLIDTLDNNHITWMILVPSVLHGMLDVLKKIPGNDLKQTLQSMRVIISGGEELTTQLAEEFYATLPHIQLANAWGMTETAGDVTLFFVQSAHVTGSRRITIGPPLQNTNMYILDDSMIPVPIGESGTCYVSGPSVIDRYYQTTKSKKVLSVNPFEMSNEHQTLLNTGDIMRLEHDILTNALVPIYLGRKDSMVKYNGFRIDLNEISLTISTACNFEQVVVLLHHRDQDEDQRLVAYCKVREGNTTSGTENDIPKHLDSLLPYYMIPKLLYIDDFPILPNGKIDKVSLYDMFKQSGEKIPLSGH